MLVPPKAWASPSTLGTYLYKRLKIKENYKILFNTCIQSLSKSPNFLWFDFLAWSAIKRNMSKYFLLLLYMYVTVDYLSVMK